MLHGHSRFGIAYITSILLHSMTLAKYSHWIVRYEFLYLNLYLCVCVYIHTHTQVYIESMDL